MKLKSIIITSAVLCLSVSALAACGKQQKETETAGTTETVTKASDTARRRIKLPLTSKMRRRRFRKIRECHMLRVHIMSI